MQHGGALQSKGHNYYMYVLFNIREPQTLDLLPSMQEYPSPD